MTWSYVMHTWCYESGYKRFRCSFSSTKHAITARTSSYNFLQVGTFKTAGAYGVITDLRWKYAELLCPNAVFCMEKKVSVKLFWKPLCKGFLQLLAQNDCIWRTRNTLSISGVAYCALKHDYITSFISKPSLWKWHNSRRVISVATKI